MLIMRTLLAVFCATTLFKSVSAAKECCPSGHFVTKNSTLNNVNCLNFTTHDKTPINLKCKLDSNSVISADIKNFTENDAGDLITTSSLYFQEEYYGEQMRNPISAERFCKGTRVLRINKQRVEKEVFVLCYPERHFDDDARNACMGISAIFLLLTASVYISMPELRDVHGKSVATMTITLAAGLIVFLVNSNLEGYSDMNLCAARGFLVYFFLVAAFFWMNAISVQLLCSIRRPTLPDFGCKTYLLYSAYCWGFAAALTITMAVVNFLKGEHQRPGIGLEHCWFISRKQQWIYLYSVMTILTAINILIFVYISSYLWRHNFDSRNIKALRYKFFLMIRLCIVMGLPWIFEMILIESNHPVLSVINILTMLIGFYVFLVMVVFRKKTVKALYKKGWLCCFTDAVERYLAKGTDEEDIIKHETVITLG